MVFNVAITSFVILDFNFSFFFFFSFEGKEIACVLTCNNLDITQRWMKHSEVERSSNPSSANASFNLQRKSERFIHFLYNRASS